MIATGCLVAASPVWTGEVGTFRLEAGGEIRDVRLADWNADGRQDVVAIVRPHGEERDVLLLLATPQAPVASTWFDPAQARRIRADGALARAGAVAAGTFAVVDKEAPASEPRRAVLRFFTPEGSADVSSDGEILQVHEPATLLERDPSEALCFWDGVADLDGDAWEESWHPEANVNASLVVRDSRRQRVFRLPLHSLHQARSGEGLLFERTTWIPTLRAADLDGTDPVRELICLWGRGLAAFRLPATAATGPLEPVAEFSLPFLNRPDTLGDAMLYTPRASVDDVNGDGVADLIVTLLTGQRDRPATLRTTLFLWIGPLSEPLGAPASRLDTESAVLHPVFVDLEGDGDLDYVADSIRSRNLVDLAARMLGQDPPLTLEGFSYDKEGGTYAPAPAFHLQRAYPSSEALANTFGRTMYLEGDLDGDGAKDLVDLGTLDRVTVWSGRRPPPGQGARPASAPYAQVLAGPFALPERVQARALAEDLNGDRRCEVLLWSATTFYLLSGTLP